MAIRRKLPGLTQSIGVRFTKLELQDLRRAAALVVKRPTQFIRERAVADARIVLEGERLRK